MGVISDEWNGSFKIVIAMDCYGINRSDEGEKVESMHMRKLFFRSLNLSQNYDLIHRYLNYIF